LECGPYENINNAESVGINRPGLTYFSLSEAKQATTGCVEEGGGSSYLIKKKKSNNSVDRRSVCGQPSLHWPEQSMTAIGLFTGCDQNAYLKKEEEEEEEEGGRSP